MPFRRFAFFVALIATILGTPARSSAQVAAAPVRVFAAASLADALNALGPMFQRGGHRRPVFSFAASSVLARQIEQGAPADLFISADEAWMDYLDERRLIEGGTRASFLSNRLVLVAPRDRPFSLQIRPGVDLAGALGRGRLAMADPDSVPAGRYGRAALQRLGLWDSVSASVIRGDNVRTALRFVETGEAAAGIVYATDARIAGSSVTIVDVFPQDAYPRISYPLAIVRGGREAAARELATFLQSSAALAVFAREGFVLTP